MNQGNKNYSQGSYTAAVVRGRFDSCNPRTTTKAGENPASPMPKGTKRRQMIYWDDITGDIGKETLRQKQIWGIQNHSPLKWLAILMEEVGEVSKAILEKDYEGYYEELVQVAAVAVTALDSVRRYESSSESKEGTQ